MDPFISMSGFVVVGMGVGTIILLPLSEILDKFNTVYQVLDLNVCLTV